MAEKNQPTIIVQSGGPLQIVIIVILVIQSFFLGSLWTKVQFLERGGVANAAPTAPQPQAALPAAAQPPAPQKAGPLPKITDRDHVRGNRNAKIALVEYSDLECPFCKTFHPTAKRIVDEYAGKVMWVYRHYPLSFHANAQKEAEASECANELGGADAFWKFVDAIYDRTTSNGTGFALDKLVPLAEEIGLDGNKFKDCLDNGKYTQYVKDDEDGGTKAGVTGTPGNILLNVASGDTQLIPGAVPFEQIKPSLDAMLK